MMRGRLGGAGVAVLSLGAVVSASMIQASWGLQPCTMCITQRYAFLISAALGMLQVFLYAKVERPLRWALSLVALCGMLASARIQWALSHPGGVCGRDAIANFLNDLPTATQWPAIFEATGVCGDKVPPVLGIQFHVWSFSLFLAFVALAWLPRAKLKKD